jgi:hypothetical protein
MRVSTHAGMNVFELLFFVANVAIGVAVASWASRRFGWIGGVIGFVGGFAVIPTICHFVFRADRVLRDDSKGSTPQNDGTSVHSTKDGDKTEIPLPPK